MSVPSIVMIASVMLAPAIDPGIDQVPEPAPDELERAIAMLEALDVAVVSIEADAEPLAAVLGRIGEQVPLEVDWVALDLIGVSRDDPISLELDRAPLVAVLASVVLQSGDAFERPIFEPHKGRIVVTTQEGSVPMRLTDVYDVRDLLTNDDTIDAVRSTLPPLPAGDDKPVSAPAGEAARDQEGDAEDEPAGAGGEPARPTLPEITIPSRDAAPPRRLTPGEELVSLIVEHVDPDAWRGFGGTRATISEHEGVLMVSAVPGTHRRLRDALRRLRRAHLSQVSIEAAIIDVSRSEFDRLRRLHDLASAALGRALLAAGEGRVCWRTSTAAALDRTLSLTSRKDGLEVQVRLVPRFDRESGLLTFDVEATTTAEADARALTTSVTIPFRDGGSVLEIPAAGRGDEVRLLVLIPSRG